MKPTHTSESLPIKVDFLTTEQLQQPGRIGLMIAPGRCDEDAKAIWRRDLQADLRRLKEHYSVNRLVCLLDAAEREFLGIPTLLEDAAALGMATENLPIEDDALPTSLDEFSALVDWVLAAVAAGETVAIHCRGGGRTGTLAASCLVKLGYDAEAAIATVQAVRSGALSVAAQREFVHQFAQLPGNTVGDAAAAS